MIRAAQTRRYLHAGFTLVELMVALTISLLLLAGISQVFITGRSTYTYEENLARTQEAGRFSAEFLAQDIRMAGFTGCNSQLAAANINNIAQPVSMAYQFLAGGLRGYRYSGTGTNNLTDWQPNLPADFFGNGDVRAGTDVIIVQRASILDANLTGNMNNSGDSLQILSTAAIANQIKADDILMVADCRNVDVFRANSVSNGSGKITMTHSSQNLSSGNLSKLYTTQAQLMKLVSRAYFIGTGQSGEPVLMRRELVTGPTLTTSELVEGIEAILMTYGEDTSAPLDRTPDIYRTANNVAVWENVVTVRVGLLARTPAKIDSQPDTSTYSFDGLTLGPANDNRRRQFFLSTIQVRN